ncbi:sensor histidine kinase [Allomuricauda sp. ARW1Y1]|jgi:Na+/proline symporter/nitrogen-specific signal transduction histidine kinase|uniref:sensor histidine kinase n=1 Tax=Allomuricauda sp. ARW1Y1 TaxID=2663843 RepID=UPI0015CA6B31|nr:sensor histidine kinase [Muricauda sp. ARW1Y1]NYJ28117.1 Na+/proline symporter/signal transduction histidine kinase [Muricauda sp. ARW1Y1]
MSNYAVGLVIVLYLSMLFVIAYVAEKNKRSKWTNNPYVYTLSLAVYCTAWTYYGSVGIASSSGISFLAIYLGPVLAMPLWIVLMKKVIRISKQHKISSIADFISIRYGNNRQLGALVTLTCLFAIIPYISLQLKAVSETFSLISAKGSYQSTGFFDDSTFYIALLIAVFVAFYGTLSTDTSEHRKGIVATVALESILKLCFFLAIGVYVAFYLFDGTTDIYQQASLRENFDQLTTFGGLGNGFNWLFTICLSFFAIFLLPRQFHVAVVENDNENHLRKAIWLFPLYLLLFNVFVISIAWAGNIRLDATVNHDYYSLLLPLQQNDYGLAVMVFIGGFTTVISMIVVSTLALSTMVSNNIVIPYGFIKTLVEGNPEENAKRIKNIRRISIFLLIIAAYFFYIRFSVQLSLYSIGLISFLIIAQLAPSFFLGLTWRRGTARAAETGMLVGLAIVFYTIFLPVISNIVRPNVDILSEGLFGYAWFKPAQTFGFDYLSPESNAFLWSMAFNTLSFVAFSLNTKGNYRERNYAEMFVNHENYGNLQEGGFIWKGEAYVADIKRLLNRFLGEQRTNRALQLFNRKYNISETEERADARLINFSEKLLTGSIGSASAKILLASVSKETPISLVEVLHILEESKETKANNKLLQEKSNELAAMAQQLKSANEELRIQDKLKDEFLDTVAHELKTPVTSIKAASEVLEDADMPAELRAKFLENINKDSDRLDTLIRNILDLEKLSGNRTELEMEEHDMSDTIRKAINGVEQIASKKGMSIKFSKKQNVFATYDEDRILQVLTNLLSNSLKFTEPQTGKIRILLEELETEVSVVVKDNGRGIPDEDKAYIFDKFYQSKNQNIKKPQGSGLGLAICKKIVESHAGTISVDKDYKKGALIRFLIPKEQ